MNTFILTDEQLSFLRFFFWLVTVDEASWQYTVLTHEQTGQLNDIADKFGRWEPEE